MAEELSPNHTLAQTQDGSFTAYSKRFEEHYHSTKDGALNESLQKHVLPAFELKKNKNELHILDICFGLGLNTLATLHHYAQNAPKTKLFIYSPEIDAELVASLGGFAYPKEFSPYMKIVESLASKGVYASQNISIELFLGDAREYVRGFENRFDIVYQDAFSPAHNPTLWTVEYFGDIAKAMKNDGVLTTYSTALKTRLALHENGFSIYLLKHQNARNSTVASLEHINGLEIVDMEHKIACNQKTTPLSDTEVAQTNLF